MNNKIQGYLDEIKKIEDREKKELKENELTKSALIQKAQQIELEDIQKNGLEFVYAKCGQFFSSNKVLRLGEIDNRETNDGKFHTIIKSGNYAVLGEIKLTQEKLDKIGSIISKTDVTLKIYKSGTIEVV
jgi:hypothetical protein